MFLSTLMPTKRTIKMYSIIGSVPKEIKNELKDTRIVYRGIVSINGKEGDLLIRDNKNKVYNIIWKEDYGEKREIDRGLLKSLVRLYDRAIQDMVVKQPKKVLDKMYIINQKIMLKSTAFKKTQEPLT